MRKRLPKFYFKFYLMMIAFSLAGSAPAQLQHTPSPSEDSLKKFLRDYLKDTGPAAEDTVGYFAAFVDLNGDGRKEVIVYLTRKGWCGSGGCNSLVLAPEGSSYKSCYFNHHHLATDPGFRHQDKRLARHRRLGSGRRYPAGV